jgi:predicted RNase H-like nuclease (RuvC/YqgF family)
MAFLALLAKPAIAGLIKFVIGAGLAYFAAKPVIERWGSTPASRAEQLGVPRDRLYEDYKKFREDKKKYLQERNEEHNKHLVDELAELKKKLEKLEKQKTKQAEEITNENDPTEKAKKIAAMKDTEKEISRIKKEISDKEKQIEKNNKELEKVFDDIGKFPNLTQEQLSAKSNTPDLGAWKN